MKGIMKGIICSLVMMAGFSPQLLWAAEHQSIEGLWTTISDETHKPHAVVRLFVRHNELTGEVVKVYKQKGDKGYCINCPAPFKDKNVIGLHFLWGLKQVSDTQWVNGNILDPRTGHIYRSNVTLNKDGKSVSVRGYFGFALLGRTQTWVKRDIV